MTKISIRRSHDKSSKPQLKEGDLELRVLTTGILEPLVE